MQKVKKLRDWEAVEGNDFPLGVTFIAEENAFNFAIYSKHATAVTLLVYAPGNLEEPVYRYSFDPSVNKSHRIWHCRVSAALLGNGKYYAYKIDGPEPAGQKAFHRFDRDKILLDPYAKAVFFPPAFSRQAARLPGTNDGKAALGVFEKEEERFDWEGDQYITHDHDLIIYELHIRGYTFHPSSAVSTECRGTYRGLVEKIPYLKELGITAVELMPVFQFDIQSNDYWGYTPLNFFSPHHAYACSTGDTGQLNEFKFMVRELHKAGIEVILDVVYNHTTEGNHSGPIYSYKGIDNSTYYLINEDLADPYFNYSGTGNTLHTKNNHVRRMILDSLRYWRREMHVDGFRFDLASVFSRNPDGSISFEEPPIFAMIGADPDLANARLIAEPWDALGTMQLGTKFPGVVWMQWNSFFRDHLRRFVRGDEGMIRELVSRMYGSADLFADNPTEAYHAYQSVNYINCHDGFTLYDQVSYNGKHNFMNGHDNMDGQQENFSWNCGKEGGEELPAEVLALRRQQAKNFFVLLLLANGTPMFVAGDEFLRTQKGNNNPYNQDNEISWVNWSLRKENEDFFSFCRKMIAFRKAHPSLCRSRFWRNDVQWFGANGEPDFGYYSKSLAFFLRGGSEHDDDLYIMANAHYETVVFTFQMPGPWQRIINTALPHGQDFADENPEPMLSETYALPGRSVAVFVKKST